MSMRVQPLFFFSCAASCECLRVYVSIWVWVHVSGHAMALCVFMSSECVRAYAVSVQARMCVPLYACVSIRWSV